MEPPFTSSVSVMWKEDLSVMLIDVWNEALHAMILLSPPIILGATFSIIIAKLYSLYLKRSLWPSAIVLFMFALFGTTIGIFMGASRQPIIASTLPPIITLISGYIAFTKTGNLAVRTRLILPAGVMLLLMFLLLGAFYMRGYTSVADDGIGADAASNVESD